MEVNPLLSCPVHLSSLFSLPSNESFNLTKKKKKKRRREEVLLTKLFEPCMLCTFSYIKAYIRFFVFRFF